MPELQFLGPEQKRETDVNTLRNHLETLLVLVTKGGEAGKSWVQDAGAYVIIRELHLETGDEAVREVCERVVQILMGDDADGDGELDRQGTLEAASGGKMITQRQEEEDDDDKVIEIF